jgi:hypothetical protein
MKGVKMKRLKISNVAMLVVWCLSIFAGNSWGQVKPDELAKIEQAVPVKATVQSAKPRKLLVFNLCNGFKHDSIPYWDKALEIMGAKSGVYSVVVSSDMAMFKPENLNQFDAVCLNNTTRLQFDEPLRKSLMDFVKGGKGIVGIHAATDNFYEWPEAAEMMGGQFAGHPWGGGGTWAIKIDEPNHPLMAAFKGKGFKIQDEIYRTKPPLYSRTKQRVLMSLDMSDGPTRSAEGVTPEDMDTGISWVKSYDKGRIFYCALGHDHAVTWNPAVLQHFLDGIQFVFGDYKVDTKPKPLVISGKGSEMDELFAKIKTYDWGQSRAPLSEVSELIRKAHTSPEQLKQMEKNLLEVLVVADATYAGKQFVCRELSIIGTEQSVPALGAMLTDEKMSDMARYALERIPGAAVDEALRNALGKTSGKTKVGIINSIGQRRDGKAVSAIGELVGDSDQMVAGAALGALGQIADAQATKILADAKDKVTDKLQLVALDAYLKCADKLVAEGEKDQALAIYKELYKENQPKPIRTAALRGIVSITKKEEK